MEPEDIKILAALNEKRSVIERNNDALTCSLADLDALGTEPD